jgi:hypothetical protein
MSVSQPLPGQTADSGRVLYVRQSVGDDANDGLSPESAWRTLPHLGGRLRAGDTAYVGPGLYRESLILANGGTPDRRITIMADPNGHLTGDPPGVVVISGSDPVDESIFAPYVVPQNEESESMPEPATAPDAQHGAVYHARVPVEEVMGVVEMDGPQLHYANAIETMEHLRDDMSPLQVVAMRPSSFFIDEAGVLFLHTSDGRAPSEHEMEFVHRRGGIQLWGKPHVTVVGFTIRHNKSAGIVFGHGSDGGIATANTIFGNHQGIAVRRSTGVVLAFNTLFRNDNSGLYFLAEATDGTALRNVLFENLKGIRWGSASSRGVAAGNLAFENTQAGVSIERVDDVRLVGNSLVQNGVVQLNLVDTRYTGEGNCFATSGPDLLLVKTGPWTTFTTLAGFQEATANEKGSREASPSSCRPLPEKPPVREIHRRATSLQP